MPRCHGCACPSEDDFQVVSECPATDAQDCAARLLDTDCSWSPGLSFASFLGGVSFSSVGGRPHSSVAAQFCVGWL